MKGKINYKMITLARESRGITQSNLAKKISNLTQGNLSRIEMGILPINETTLLSIANLLNYPIDFFYKREIQTPISNFYYRKRIMIPKRVLSQIEAQMDIVRLSIDELMNSIELPDFNFPQIDISFKGDPADAARKIRDYLKLPKGPIINIVNIFEKHGIIVYFIDTNCEKFDGITLFTDKNQPIIFIDKKIPNDRKRFTLGHELGHLVMHIPFVIDNFRNEEEEANSFSSEFNMPYLECRNDIINLKYNDLGKLKSYWKLSKAAIIVRAKQLKLITEEKYKYLMIELGRRGERKHESGLDVDIDEPTLIPQMIKIFKNNLNYNTEEISAILGLSISDFNMYFDNNYRKMRIVI
ncbi:MAG: XRE family transcriptional regulator [Bacteroidota bacterium]|nr:XRE family transcriptional regulator [Bacteroidota bacterium]